MSITSLAIALKALTLMSHYTPQALEQNSNARILELSEMVHARDEEIKKSEEKEIDSNKARRTRFDFCFLLFTLSISYRGLMH